MNNHFKKEFLICFLQHRNINFTINSFLHLHYAIMNDQYLIQKIKIIIAYSGYFKHILNNFIQIFHDIYDIELMECQTEYLSKIELILNNYNPNDYKYFIKHDEDVFLSSLTWNNLIKFSPDILEKKNNLLTTVNLSTGIPTWSYFVNCFFDEKSKFTFEKEDLQSY